jgi:hypothetical protein
MITAAEMRISVVEFDRVGGFGLDGGDVSLAAGAEASMGRTTVAA